MIKSSSSSQIPSIKYQSTYRKANHGNEIISLENIRCPLKFQTSHLLINNGPQSTERCRQRVKLQPHRAFPPGFFDNVTPKPLNNSTSEDQNHSSRKQFYLPMMRNNQTGTSGMAKQLNQTSNYTKMTHQTSGLIYNPYISFDNAEPESASGFIHVADYSMEERTHQTEPDCYMKDRFINKENLSSRNENNAKLKGLSSLIKTRKIENGNIWLNQSGFDMGSKRDDLVPKLLLSPSNEDLLQLNQSVLSSSRMENNINKRPLSNSRSSLLGLAAKNALHNESMDSLSRGYHISKIRSEPVHNDNDDDAKNSSKLIKSASRDGLRSSGARKLIAQRPQVKNYALETSVLFQSQERSFTEQRQPKNNLTIDVIAFEDEKPTNHPKTPRRVINQQPILPSLSRFSTNQKAPPTGPLKTQRASDERRSPILVTEDSSNIQILINIQKQEAFNFSFSEKFPISLENKDLTKKVEGETGQHHLRTPTAEFVVSQGSKIAAESENNIKINAQGRKKVVLKRRES